MTEGRGTAIDGLVRLETPATWHPGGGAPPREVYAAIGTAELVILGPDEAALDHWSLPAIRRRDGGGVPARYGPGEAGDETLEISEPEMIDALDRVLAAVEGGRRRPGRLRAAILAALLAPALGAAVVWGPGALRDHAARVLPPAQHEEIGDRLLVALAALTGPPCGGLLGDEALGGLRVRLLPTDPVRLRVVQDLPMPALALPGDLLVMSNDTLLAQDDPAVAAGHVVATRAGAATDPPLLRFLDGVGTGGVLRLLTSGALPQAAYAAHVEALIARPPAPPPDDALRPAFVRARLDWAPYAQATGRPPQGGAPDMRPALDDTDWQSLRGICEA